MRTKGGEGGCERRRFTEEGIIILLVWGEDHFGGFSWICRGDFEFCSREGLVQGALV